MNSQKSMAGCFVAFISCLRRRVSGLCTAGWRCRWRTGAQLQDQRGTAKDVIGIADRQETLKEEGLNRVSSVLASPFSQGRSRGGRSRPTGVFAPATKGLSYLLVSLMSLSAFLRALKELDLPAPPPHVSCGSRRF